MLGSFSDTRGSVSDFLLYITAKKKDAKSVMRSERSMVSSDTKLFTSSSGRLNDVWSSYEVTPWRIKQIFPPLVLGPFGMFFFLRFWCQTEPYENTFDRGFEEQFLLIHTSMRVFVLYFLGGGGGGWSRAARGRSVVLATYIRDSSAEIDYQLIFSISLSFAKIY